MSKKNHAKGNAILIGDLHPELTMLGIKTGDHVNLILDRNSKSGAAHFQTTYNGFTIECTVWPDNYTLINPKAQN